MPAESETLAGKLDRLFRLGQSPGGGEHTYREVAEGIAARGRAPISATYIWQLRTGRRANPSRKHIEELAGFFRVPVNYFFNDQTAAEVEAELELVVALRREPVKHIALRAADLTSESLAAIAGMIEHVRRLEGLPHEATPTSNGAGAWQTADRGD